MSPTSPLARRVGPLLLGLALATYCVAARADAAEPLRWPVPPLVDPIVIKVTNSNHNLNLDNSRDYILQMPTDAPLTATGGLLVRGGHNVVLIGGEIYIPYQGPSPTENGRRGLYLNNQTGVVHVEGLLIDGEDLNEGINLDQRLGATVQFQNVRVDNARPRDAADRDAHHTDILQTWAGPARLRIDRLTASSGYQGLFLVPTQYGTNPTVPYELSNINLTGLEGSAYMLWKADSLPLVAENVWVQPAPNRWLKYSVWTSPEAWGPGVIKGSPPSDFVPAGVAGRHYISPSAPE